MLFFHEMYIRKGREGGSKEGGEGESGEGGWSRQSSMTGKSWNLKIWI